MNATCCAMHYLFHLLPLHAVNSACHVLLQYNSTALKLYLTILFPHGFIGLCGFLTVRSRCLCVCKGYAVVQFVHRLLCSAFTARILYCKRHLACKTLVTSRGFPLEVLYFCITQLNQGNGCKIVVLASTVFW